MERLLEEYDVWINGVRSAQSFQRAMLSEIDSTGSKAVRYHPLLSWSNSDIESYIAKHKLPKHPLDHKGYKSIGCEPCTRPDTDGLRQGRWFGMRKEECGLNTELVKTQNSSSVKV